MTVNLSALAGAGQQFFSDAGVPLAGGKLYSYVAGTTTPQVAYTSASGATPLSNPIILNSAGRVATGEIWLTTGSSYKFILKTSDEVTIATWDNIIGINGISPTINAVNVVYTPAGIGAVTTNAQAKLRESVSIQDFGASTSASVTANTTAITAALAYAGTVKCAVYVPGAATAYQVNDEFTVPDGVTVFGDGWGSFIQQITLNKDVFIAGDCNTFQNLRLKIANGNNLEFVNCIYASSVNNLTVEGCFLEPGSQGGCGIHIRNVQNSQIRGNRIYGATYTQIPGPDASAADILLYSSGTSERHIIDGNHCLSNNSQGIFVSALGYDGDIIISNNICVTLDPVTCTETGTWALVANGGVRRHGMVVSYNLAQPGRPRIIVDGNICRNTRLTGIYKQGESDNEIIISNNLCDLNGYNSGDPLSGGIYVESPGRASVIGNTITNFQNTLFSTGGITLNQIPTGESIPGFVSGNKITDSLGNGIALGTSSRLVTISNNVIFGSAGNDISAINSGGVAVVGGNTITGNTIYRTSGNNIPSIYYDQQASTRYATIKDNTIQGFDNTNADVENSGIRLRQSNDLVQVFGNVISNFYYGFTCVSYYTAGRLEDQVIARNSIIDCAVGFGVSALNNNNTLPLVDNVFVNTPLQTSSIAFAVGRIVQRLGNNFVWQTTAAPTVGSWAVGDRSVNSTPVVGQPKAWACTVAGTPGTWVSEGNL